MWQFADVSLVWLPLILLVLVAWRIFRRRRGAATVYPLTSHLPPLPRSGRLIVMATTRFAFLAGSLLIIIALARPQVVHTRITQRPDNLAIQMVVDVSGSMAALDFASPEEIRDGEYHTRLDVVKEVFSDFIQGRPDDLIGLITFGGYAISRVPLTADHDLLRFILDDIAIPTDQTDREGRLLNPAEQMTALGDALALACARLADIDIASRVVVLLSDGESNFGIIEPDEATRIARAMQIRVYTIAVGTEDKVPFLGRDMAGRPAIQHAVIGLDSELLQRMADPTGGLAFHVSDPDGLTAAMSAIDKLETSPAEPLTLELYNEQMAWPLSLGLIFILMAITTRCVLDGEII